MGAVMEVMNARKAYELARYDRGQCRSCEEPRDSESASCPKCRVRNSRTSSAAYWKGRERKRVMHCSECDKPGHNVVTCPMAKR